MIFSIIFTQDDLNKGELIFIVPKQEHTTHDNFLFSVVDEIGDQ